MGRFRKVWTCFKEAWVDMNLLVKNVIRPWFQSQEFYDLPIRSTRSAVVLTDPFIDTFPQYERRHYIYHIPPSIDICSVWSSGNTESIKSK